MIRFTIQSLSVLSQLIRRPHGLAGFDMLKADQELKSGTVYPLLHRLEREGWLSSQVERGDPRKLGRPLRRTFKLTKAGKQNVQKILERLAP